METEQDVMMCDPIFVSSTYGYVRTFLEEANVLLLPSSTWLPHAPSGGIGRPAGSWKLEGIGGSHCEKHPLHFIRVESADDGAASTILSLAGR